MRIPRARDCEDIRVDGGCKQLLARLSQLQDLLAGVSFVLVRGGSYKRGKFCGPGPQRRPLSFERLGSIVCAGYAPARAGGVAQQILDREHVGPHLVEPGGDRAANIVQSPSLTFGHRFDHSRDALAPT